MGFSKNGKAVKIGQLSLEELQTAEKPAPIDSSAKPEPKHLATEQPQSDEKK